MKKSSIDSQEEARARLKEKMENKRRKQSKSLSKKPKDNDEKSGWSITFDSNKNQITRDIRN